MEIPKRIKNIWEQVNKGASPDPASEWTRNIEGNPIRIWLPFDVDLSEEASEINHLGWCSQTEIILIGIHTEIWKPYFGPTGKLTPRQLWIYCEDCHQLSPDLLSGVWKDQEHQNKRQEILYSITQILDWKKKAWIKQRRLESAMS